MRRSGRADQTPRWTRPVFFAALALTLCVAGCQPKADAPSEEAAAPAAETPAPGGYAPPRLNEGPPVDGPATLEFSGPVGAGAAFEVRWTGPANKGDYIDIVPRGATRTAGEISYAYVRDTRPTGAALRAPTAAGEYDVRYIVELESSRKAAVVVPLSIVAATATLTAPAQAMGGATIKVEWSGPNGEGDYIDIVPEGKRETSGEIAYAYTRDGTPATLTAPGSTGTYEVRYLLEGPGGRQVLARAPLSVETPTATLEVKAAAARGEILDVTWTGPNNPGDYVDIVPKGYGATSGEISYAYTRDGSPAQVNAPPTRGEFEIRYVMEAPKGRLILARAPLKVE
jgi:Ca-activated chloride channel homolog